MSNTRTDPFAAILTQQPYPAVANAFAIMGIVMAIFAVLACDFYGERDHYNFGSFTRAYFLMFQVLSLLHFLVLATTLSVTVPFLFQPL